MSLQQSNPGEEIEVTKVEQVLDLSPYPINMTSFLVLSHCTIDTLGVPHLLNPVGYHPTTIVQYALAQWNEYLMTTNEYHRNIFLIQANWLVDHAVRIGEDASGWPISFPCADVSTGSSWLSALTQGNAISVLMRAYQLTNNDTYLRVANRAIRTFERDILDGGVSTSINVDSIFFEEVAVYPATHSLSGFLFALFGLYDYLAFIDDAKVEQLIHRSLATLHHLLDEFDAGFWAYSDLLHRELVFSSRFALQIELLEALATYSHCDHCSTVASRWKKYQHSLTSRLRYHITTCCIKYKLALWRRVRTKLFPPFPTSPMSQLLRVCVAVNAFPVLGGIRTVLAGVAQITEDRWQIEYLTKEVGREEERHIIYRFGTTKMPILQSAWQFPFVWLYVLAGWWKLLMLMRRGAGYHVILPQDGVFTAAFTSLAAKLAGVRVVCIDHGSLTLIKSQHYQIERISNLKSRKWPIRLLGRLLFSCYWPSLYLLAWIAARFVDHYLIPGVAGDGVEEMCQRLRIPPSRLTRFDSMIDIDRHILLDAQQKADLREKFGIAADAIIIAIICRLMPEKGLEIALESICQALALLSPELRSRVHVIIAGDGLLRKQVEEGVQLYRLSHSCELWGDIVSKDVLSLLAMSDIFLNTTIRGTCLPLSILEAMASGCAVIATNEPIANEHLLAEGRGVVVLPGDARQTSTALVRLVNDAELRCRMGRLAREYIAVQHSPTKFRRTLMRVTCWSALDELLDREKDKTVEKEVKANNGVI